MEFYFTDRFFSVLGVASTSGDSSIALVDEKDVLSVAQTSRSLSGTLTYDKKDRRRIKLMGKLGNYIIYQDELGSSVWMTIMETDDDPQSCEYHFVAEDAGMDLINELVGPYIADKAYPISHYLERFAYDSGFEIGINEIPNLTRKLEWESEESTALARIISVGTQFDNAEIVFRFEFEGTEITNKYIDILVKRGADEGVTLYVNQHIDQIRTKGSIYDLGTSLYGTGGIPEGKEEPINLKGYKWTDPDGRYVLGSDGVMRDTEAVQIWSRLLSIDNPNPQSAHIQRLKTYETDDKETLCTNVLRDLKEIAEPVINYETEITNLPDNVQIGDTIYLVDEEDELYLSARVLELMRCYSADSYTATLGDYLIQESGISINLQEIADKLKDQIKPGDTYYPWTRYADDANGTGMSSVPDGKTYMATTHRKNDPIASDDPADYAGLWVRIKGDPGIGEKGDPGTSPIITPNDDGTITIVDEEGTKTTPDLTGPQGDKGVGVDSENTKTDYQLHTSATTPPTGTWVTSPPAVIVGKYLWTRTILEYTDGAKSTPAYSVSGGPGKDGDKGDQGPPTGVISQNTIPSNPYVGMLWQCTGNIAGYVNPATYRWNGSAWEIYQFTAQNILADTFVGFVFRGVEFIGSRFVSEFSRPGDGAPGDTVSGQTVIENGAWNTQSMYKNAAGEIVQTKQITVRPEDGFSINSKTGDNTQRYGANLLPSGLYLEYPVSGQQIATLLGIQNIYALVKPATRIVSPAATANHEKAQLTFKRFGDMVIVSGAFTLKTDTGWVNLCPPQPGYQPSSIYAATTQAVSASYRGETCAIYYNTSNGYGIIPPIGIARGEMRFSMAYVTLDPFPYSDSY